MKGRGAWCAWIAIAAGLVWTPLAYRTYYQDRMDLPSSPTASGTFAKKMKARFSEFRLFCGLAAIGGGVAYLFYLNGSKKP